MQYALTDFKFCHRTCREYALIDRGGTPHGYRGTPLAKLGLGLAYGL
jgi:hypothetical protein